MLIFSCGAKGLVGADLVNGLGGHHQRVAVVGAEVRHPPSTTTSMTSLCPPNAASGKPPPMLLAR